MQAELEAALLMNDRCREVIFKLQDMNAVWMARALKAELGNRRG